MWRLLPFRCGCSGWFTTKSVTTGSRTESAQWTESSDTLRRRRQHPPLSAALNSASFTYPSADFPLPRFPNPWKNTFAIIVARAEKQTRDQNTRVWLSRVFSCQYHRRRRPSSAVYTAAHGYLLLLRGGAQDVAGRNRALWLVRLYLQCVTPMVCAAAASCPQTSEPQAPRTGLLRGACARRVHGGGF